MPTPIRSPELIPGLHQSLCKPRMKIFLKIAFISNQPPELSGFPSLFDRIKCCVVKETVDMPVWIAHPVNRSRIAMEKLRVEHLTRSAILLQTPLRTLHCISDSMARIVSSTADLAIFSTAWSPVIAR